MSDDTQGDLFSETNLVHAETQIRQELSSALAGDAHNLSEALLSMLTATKTYRREVAAHMKVHEDLLGYASACEEANDNLVEVLRNLAVILNASKETAFKITGIDTVLPKLDMFLLNQTINKAKRPRLKVVE